ncbi:hypothetical protein B0T20DRAFT_411865 [Sordaria brevicollis]|uniref:Uncharacterized protein n=1 Tax=Sordaria brevicollis TaxID=83679 RepID=A0AAE0PEY9_SORBR|nr:hypothetical protein B0T20DRAFT_411865 [Sordaria brevicollis]
MRLSSLQRMATDGLSATPAHPPRGHNRNVDGRSLATVAAKLVLLCAIGTGLVGGPLGVNGQTLTTATSAASAAVATAAPLDIATPTSTTTADHHKQVSSDSAPASISGSDVITSLAKPAAEPTAVSVWLPAYEDRDWENVRGSIMSKHEAMTVYTIFCAQGQPNCALSADAPFVFTEGPSSLKYTGVLESTFSQEMHCTLNGTARATCVGTSSVNSNYVLGTVTGPAETTWTKTYSSANITWAVLTLSTPGPMVGTTDIDGTAVATLSGTDPDSILGSEGLFAPTGTPKNGAAGGAMVERITLLGAAVAGVVGGVLVL